MSSDDGIGGEKWEEIFIENCWEKNKKKRNEEWKGTDKSEREEIIAAVWLSKVRWGRSGESVCEKSSILFIFNLGFF